MTYKQLQVRCPNCGSYDTGISSKDSTDDYRQTLPYCGCLSLGGVIVAAIGIGGVVTGGSRLDGNSPQTDVNVAIFFAVIGLIGALYFY